MHKNINRYLPALLSTLIAVILLVYTFALWHQNVRKEQDALKTMVQEKANLVKHNLKNQIINSVIGLRRMAQRWELRVGTPRKEWSADATNYLVDINSLSAIEWIDANYRVQWVEPKKDNENLIGAIAEFDTQQKDDFEKVAYNLSIFLTPPLHLIQGYEGFIAYIPIYKNQTFQGFIAGVYNAQKLIDDAVPEQVSDVFSIRLIDEGKMLYSSAETEELTEFAGHNQLDLFNRKWDLVVEPKPSFFTQQISAVPHIELVGGSIISLLTGIAIYYTLLSVTRTRQLREKSEELSKVERRQQQIVNVVEDFAIYWLDLQGNIESWNTGSARILGYNSNDILGKNHQQFFTEEEQQEGLPHIILEAALANKKYKGEGWLVRCNGTHFWASIMSEVVKNNDEKVIGFAMIIQDISDRRLLEIERSRLIAIIDECSDFIGMSDMEGNLLYHNLGAKKMVGLPPDFDLSHMKIEDMHPEWAFKMVEDVAIPAVKKQGFWNGETALLYHPTGKELPVLQTVTIHHSEEENSSYLTTIMRDISERKNAEQALKNSEETFRSAMQFAAIGMALVALDGHWLKVNEALCEIVGYSEQELLRIDFQTITHPDDLDLDLGYVKQLIEGKLASYHLEKRYIHKDGSIVWILLSGSLLRDSENKPMYFIAQVQNIAAQKKAEEELKFIAYHDVLTGLSNRKQLDISLELSMAYSKRHQTEIAIMFMDLDNFKEINDQYGHEIGDLLMIEVAKRLKASVRATDILGRLGGDEFIIGLTEIANENQVEEMAKKILNTVAKPMLLKEHEISITASIGISMYPKDNYDLKTLIKYADQALYKVKSEGRNNFGVYSLRPN